MYRHYTKALARFVAILVCIIAPAFLPPVHSQDAATPGEDRELETLLDLLAERAALYRRYALGFNCTESVIRSFYNPERGQFRRRDREVYDYIFTEAEETGELEEDRVLIEENGKRVRRSSRELELNIPPAYAWFQIFAKENRGRFLFKPAGKILQSYRLLIQLDFVGVAARPGSPGIVGWSGRVSVDSSTLNLHSIVAVPSGQDARVEAETLKYQRAFAIMGVPLASKPRTRKVEVTFGLSHEGLTYPTECTMEKSVYVRTGQQGREERVTLRYRDYRFFKVGTQVEDPRDESLTGADEAGTPPPDAAPEDPKPPG
jgi:hypothetical protein